MITMKARTAPLLLLSLSVLWPGLSCAGMREDARQLVDQKNFPGALKMYGRLLAETPDDTDLLIEAARVNAWADRHKEAIEIYQRVLHVAPQRRSDVLLPLAWQLTWSGRHRDAVTLFRESLAADPGNREARHGLAETLSNDNRLAEALGEYQQLIASDATDMKARYSEARLLLWMNRYAEAERRYQGMLRENPDDKEAVLGMARTYNWSGRHFLAAREYEAAARRWPADEGIKTDLATAQRWAGTDNLALGTLAGVSGDSAATLRRQIKIDALKGLRFSATTSYDTDRLRVNSETLAFRYPFDTTRLLQTSLRLAQLEQRGQHANGKELLVSYGDRFGAFDAPRGMIWPSVSAGVRDYEGWQTFAWRAGAKWLPVDLWRFDFDAGNEVIENISSVRNKVTFTSLGAGTEVRIHPRITAAASLGLGRFDDGNIRNRLRARIEGLVLTQPRVTLGWEGLRFSNSKPDIVRGYYNPESHIENKLISSIETTRWDWNFQARAGFGRLSEEPSGIGRGIYSWELQASRYIRDSVSLRLYVGRSDSAFNSSATLGSGYARSYGGIDLTMTF